MAVTKAARDQSSGSSARSDPIDLLNIDAHLSEGERGLRERIRSFVQERIKPNIEGWYDEAVFPREIVPEFAELGLLGMHLSGYGCAGRSAVEYGLACMELEAGDSGLRTFVSVQGSLAMSAIHKFGSEEQKQEWLPRMARGEAIGCFGLTEPTAGSDPAGMKTFARREGSDWVLNGEKRWIGLATIADVAVVWARTDEEKNPVRSFQLVQQKLVNMLIEIEKGTLLALHIGRMKDGGTLRPEQISLGKLNNVREAIEIAREARTVFGGNGVTLDHPPMRHMANLESVRTYEGTDEVHTLILGNAITGIQSFR